MTTTHPRVEQPAILRAERMARLLVSTDLSIAEAARSVGRPLTR